MPFGFGKKKVEKDAIDSKAPDGYGQIHLPNPGEQPADWQEMGTPRSSLGTVPLRGTRAGGGAFMDNGARVGYLRNLEFSAGGRSAMVKTGTLSNSVPHYNEETGQLHVSTATDDSETASTMQPNQPVMPGLAKAGGDQIDSTSGETGPERKRDRKLD